jgi:hypothetical protein
MINSIGLFPIIDGILFAQEKAPNEQSSPARQTWQDVLMAKK